MKIGILVGMENTFPPALIEKINAMNAGVTAEYLKTGGVRAEDLCEYRVIFDRISHEIPYYRGLLKHAVLNGTIVFNTNGTYTYTPNTGFLGKDSVTYKVCDLTSLCDTAILYISIPFNVNDLPLAVNDTTTTPEDVALNGTVATNDIDNSGRFDPNGFVKLDNPLHGTIVFNPNGTYTYTPTENFKRTILRATRAN